MKTDPWAGLVAADAAIAEQNAVLNGYCISPKMKSLLLTSVDGNKRPLFVNSTAQGGVPVVLGNPTYLSKSAYLPGAAGVPETLGVAGDWTSARYGIVQGMTASVSTESTLTIAGEDAPVNLWQRGMFAIKFDIEIGFRFKYKEDFVLLTGETPTA